MGSVTPSARAIRQVISAQTPHVVWGTKWQDIRRQLVVDLHFLVHEFIHFRGIRGITDAALLIHDTDTNHVRFMGHVCGDVVESVALVEQHVNRKYCV